MKISIKSIVCGSLAFIMGLITLFGLCSALGSATTYGVSIGYSENGFNLISMRSFFYSPHEENVLITVVGIFCIIQCIAAVALILCGIFSAFYPSMARTASAMVIVGLVMQFIYMVLGILFSVYYNETFLGSSSRDTRLETQAFIPFIFGTIVLVAYFVCKSKVSPRFLYGKSVTGIGAGPAIVNSERENLLSETRTQKNAVLSAGYSESERIDLISRYAQLFKDGALTEEEFAAKKKQILGL